MSAYDKALARMPDPDQTGKNDIAFWDKSLPIVDYPKDPSAPPRIIRGGMWAPQRRLFEDCPEKHIRIFVGGYGSGKSTILIKRMIALALWNTGTETAITSPNYTMSRMGLLVLFKEILAGKKSQTRSAFDYEISLSPVVSIKMFYKGRVGHTYLLSADNPDSLKGYNFSAAGMDEPFIQDFEVYKQLSTRLRHPKTRRKELVIAGTPEGVTTWGKDICEGELYEANKENIHVVRASSMDNLATGGTYISDLMRVYTDDRQRRAAMEGEFVNLSSGRVYYKYDQWSNVIDMDPLPGAKFGVGMDFNVNPMAFVVFWYTKHHLHYVQEFEQPNSDTEYACQTIRSLYGDLVDVFPDASGKSRATNAPGGKSDFTTLQQHGFRIHAHASNPTRRDRYNATNGMLSSQNGGIVGVTMSSRCKKLQNYFDQYTHENMNAQESMSHLLDAATYPIAYLYPIVRPRIITVQNFKSHAH